MKEFDMSKVEALAKAKHNCLYCLEHADGSADMHGLADWAERVEALRKEVKDMLQLVRSSMATLSARVIRRIPATC